ncbi:MAG: hypothetical protein OEW84_09340, partial [Aigarchaeota archaeon]|nr:hypothetical protein [Aigarchaeota archaeon]
MGSKKNELLTKAHVALTRNERSRFVFTYIGHPIRAEGVSSMFAHILRKVQEEVSQTAAMDHLKELTRHHRITASPGFR